MTKNNPNLTHQQNKVLFEEATEPPGSSELNFEKREGSYHCANCGVKLFKSNTSMKVALAGHHFTSLYLMHLKLQQTIISVMPEQSTIARNVEDITAIYLMMDHNQQEKDTVIMEFVWFLNLNN